MAITWKNVSIPTFGGGALPNAQAASQATQLAGVDRMINAFGNYAKREKADVGDQVTGLFDDIQSEDQFNKMKASGELDFANIKEQLGSNSVSRSQVNRLRKGKVNSLRDKLNKERTFQAAEDKFDDRELNRGYQEAILRAGNDIEALQDIETVIGTKGLKNTLPALKALSSARSSAVATQQASEDRQLRLNDRRTTLQAEKLQAATAKYSADIAVFENANPGITQVNENSIQERGERSALLTKWGGSKKDEDDFVNIIKNNERVPNQAAIRANADTRAENKRRIANGM